MGAAPERLLDTDELAALADVPLARPMHYTSGTTGRRKGVWSGVLGADDAAALAAEEIDLWGFGPEDRHLVLSPLHHSAPLRFALHTLLAGGSVLLPGPFVAERAVEAIAASRPTTTFGVPTHLRRLLEARPPVDWSSFRLIAHAGAPCPEPVKRAVLDAAPAGSVWEFYGSTEVQVTVCPPEDWLAHPGTVGRARPGRTVRADERGQLWCTVPRWARFEYWRAPEKTAAAWRGDEVTVGDLGRVDDEGFVWLDGRREDLVISGGVNVYPAEVEAVLDAHPGVAECAVFGVPDEEWGQRVVAAYVGPVAPGELAGWARDRLTPAKRPKSLHRVAELPRTSSGKVRRLDLPGVLGWRAARGRPVADGRGVRRRRRGGRHRRLPARRSAGRRRPAGAAAGGGRGPRAPRGLPARPPRRIYAWARPRPGTRPLEPHGACSATGDTVRCRAAACWRVQRDQRAATSSAAPRPTSPAGRPPATTCGPTSGAACLPPAGGRRRLRVPPAARRRRPRAGSPPGRRDPLADAFAAACDELGFPAEPDKNGGGPPGYGPVPLNVADGVRVNTATAYLSPAAAGPR